MIKQKQGLLYIPAWLKFLVIFILVIGISLRFTNLEQKPYWGDESLTSQRIAGYTNEEFKQILVPGDAISAEKISNYQNPYFNLEKDWGDAINAFKSKSEHPPLYYLMARFWMQLFGNFVSNPRSLSVVISLLIFPCLYWLCGELFESNLVGGIAITITAISPVHLIYAQEARQYSLWTVTILLSSWSLLRAIRTKSRLNWIIYALTLAFGLYTHLISIFVSATHGAYIAINQKFRVTKTIVSYVLASLLGYLLFLPWLLIFFTSNSSSVVYTERTPIASLLQNIILNVSRVVYDFNDSFKYQNLGVYLIVIAIILYALYFFISHSCNNSWLFILILVVLPFVAMFSIDVVTAGKRFAILRYYLPCILGIQIALSYLFANKIAYLSKQKIWQQILWGIVVTSFFSTSFLSCIAYSQNISWWNKYREYYHSELAQIVNQSPQPLVLAAWYDIRILSHSLAPHVRLQDIRFQKNITLADKSFDTIFVYKNEEVLKYFLANNPNYQVVDDYTWKRQSSPVSTTKTDVWQLKKLYLEKN